MNKEELKIKYTNKINQTETELSKNLLKAELKHKLKMIEKGIDTDKERSKNSDFECIGCGS